MTLKEYVERNGYKVSDLTEKEIEEVEAEMEMIEQGILISDGFFSPTGEFSQRMLRKQLG